MNKVDNIIAKMDKSPSIIADLYKTESSVFKTEQAIRTAGIFKLPIAVFNGITIEMILNLLIIIRESTTRKVDPATLQFIWGDIISIFNQIQMDYMFSVDKDVFYRRLSAEGHKLEYEDLVRKTARGVFEHNFWFRHDEKDGQVYGYLQLSDNSIKYMYISMLALNEVIAVHNNKENDMVINPLFEIFESAMHKYFLPQL